MKKQRPPINSGLTDPGIAPGQVNAAAKRIGCYHSPRTSFRGSYKMIALILALFVSSLAFAQNKTVTGKIVDSTTNQGISGATVKIKNTSRGVTADPDGMFKIEVPAHGILQISSVNYRSLEVGADFEKLMLIPLTGINKMLNEVVVVGYGTSKRSDLTGSISSVPKERLSQIPASNVLKAIEGTVAGVAIRDGTNVPGTSPGVLIRGINSINGNTDPLIVVDGNPFEGGSLNDISPSDIASIDILKDVSSTAIYGTRGANGVILVTTKRGKTGKASITFSSYAGIEDFAHTLKAMGPAEYVQKYADWKAQAGVDNNLVVPNTYEQENYKANKTTNWLNEISRQGFIQDYTLGVSGGNKDVKYYVSGDYFSEKGVLLGYQSKRGSIRSNIDATITDYLTAGVNLYFSSTNNDGGRASLLLADQVSPYGRFKNPDGTYAIFPMEQEEAIQSPMLGTLNTNINRHQDMITNVYAELKPLPGLKYRINAGYTYLPILIQSYQGRLAGDIAGGTAAIINSEQKNWIIENILTYEKNWNKNHLDVTALYSSQQNKQFSSTINASGFINDALQFNNIQGATTISGSSEAIKTNMVSQMLRLNYSFDSRYLLTVTARRDGFSAFGANTNKYGLFPSIALGWNISNERFMSNVKFVNNLKLRGSYGLSGNQSAVIPNSTISSFTTISIPSNGKPTTGVVADVLGNQDLKWESTYGSNIALDFVILNNRISGTIETYNTHTRDLVLYRALPTTTGYNQTVSNIGKVSNTGFELTLKTQNITGNGFKWETTLVYSANTNKIVDLYGDKKDDIGNHLFIGHPVDVVYDYKKTGVWQVGEDPSHQNPDATPGDLKFADLNGDGVISTDGKDQMILGQGIPKWTGGITNTFHYKDFSLNVFIQTVQGITLFNNVIDFKDFGGRQNLPGGLGYWTAGNQSNKRPKLTYVNYLGYGYPEDASFTRVKDVTFSYNFSKSLLEKLHLGGASLYITGRNLGTFTKWFGWDPEAGYRNTGDTQNNYPLVRSFILGANITLR